MNAELVLDRMGARVVAAAERAVAIEQKFRHQEQGDALRSRRRVRQTRQHEMNDVLGEVVLAPLRWGGKPVPAGLCPSLIGLAPARRHGHGAVLERRAMAIAARVERRENIRRELSGLLEHRVHEVLAEIAIHPVRQCLAKSGGVLERKGHIGNRCLVGHCRPLRLAKPMRARAQAPHDLYPACGAAWRQVWQRHWTNYKGNARGLKVSAHRAAATRMQPLIGSNRAAMVRAPWRQSMRLMGRSQVVRQRILIPPFGGSSPPAPASNLYLKTVT